MEETKTTGTEKAENRKNRIIERTAGVFLLAGLIWIFFIAFDVSRHVKTNNAQVEANMASVNSRVSGNILEIRFDSYQEVKAGDTLILLDDSEFRIKVAQAQADLNIARANLSITEQSVITSYAQMEADVAKMKGNTASLEKATRNYERYENMFADSAVTRNQFDQVIAQLRTEQAYLEASQQDVLASKSITEQNKRNLESNQATIQRKEADLAAAWLQLSYTCITAPMDGIIGERTIQLGELVSNNQTLATIVQSNQKWVIANFKETQLDKLKAGKKAIIKVDALNGKKYKGMVTELAPATGAKFSMIEPDNSTGNFVKITQRIPVKIEFEAPAEELDAIKAGMNVSVKVKK